MWSAHDDPDENYVVVYPKPVVCRDGRAREKIFYNCKGAGVVDGSPEHLARREAALKLAWGHVSRIMDKLDRGPFGKGPIQEEGAVCYHSTEKDDHCFKYHPMTPFANKSFTVWRPALDTTLPPAEFCCNCTFVRRSPEGVETWRCDGHESEVSPGAAAAAVGPEPEVDVPLERGAFAELPLYGKKMVESFAGDLTKAGGMLSKFWRDAGGEAESRDLLIDKRHDFLTDEHYWKKQVKAPSDVYAFAPP